MKHLKHKSSYKP